MGKHTKEGYSEKALAALMKGQYDELTGRSAANNWRPSKVPSLIMPKNTVPKSVPTQKITRKNGNLKDRGFGSLYEFENYKTKNMMAETQKNLQLANDLMEAASKISQVANPIDKGFPNSINDAFKAPEKKELPSLFEKAQSRKPKTNNPYEVFTKSEQKKTTKEDIDKALVGRVGKDQLNFSDIKRQDNEESQKKKAQDQAAKELVMQLDFQREVADNPLVNPNVDPIKQFTDENNTQAQLPKFDKKYEKDFEEFFDYRYDKSDVRDYDPETDRDVEHWRNLKKDIMKKYGWTEDEFNKKYGEYDNYRFAKMDAEEMALAKGLSEAHPVAGSALSVLLAPEVAAEGLETAVHGLIGDEAYNNLPALVGSDNYAQYRDNNHSATKEKNLIRQTVKDNIDSGVGKFAYDLGMGAVDLGTNMALGLGTPVGMGVVSGAQNAAMNEQSALERGVEPEKAARTGLATGVISGIMNTVGLDAVLKGTAKTVAGSILKAAGTEGLENVVEDIADRWLDNVINRENSEKNQEILYYMQNGMSEEEAYRQSFMNFINQELVSAGQGALFGGVLKGGRMAVGLDSVPSIETENIISDATRQANDARANIEALAQQIPEVPEVITNNVEVPPAPNSVSTVNSDVNTSALPQAVGESAPNPMQNVDFKPVIHNADGQLLDTVKVPEYSADNDVYFNGSDSDIAFAEAQDAAITYTFKNIVSDPEFNALSFKNGRQEVYVSPSTTGTGYRMSYTVDGVPTGHHDYSANEIDALSQNLREMAGNGGEDIRIQRKSDITSQTEAAPVNAEQPETPIRRYDEHYSDKSVDVKKRELPQEVIDEYTEGSATDKLAKEMAKRGYNLMENGGNNNILNNEFSTMNDAVAHHLANDLIPADVMAEAYDIVKQKGGNVYEAVKLAAEMSGMKISDSGYENVDISKYRPETTTEPQSRTLPERKDGTRPNYSDMDEVNGRINEANTRLEEISQELDRLDKEYNDLENLKKNKGKKAKLSKQMYELETEQKALAKKAKVLQKIADGKKVATKDVVEVEYPDVYDDVYGRNGLLTYIGFAKKFAGDTPEAQKLAQEARDALYRYLKGGDDYPDLNDYVGKLQELDKLAKETDAEYVTQGKHKQTYHYKDIFDIGYDVAGEPFDMGLDDYAFRLRFGNLIKVNEISRAMNGTELNNTGIDTNPTITEEVGNTAPADIVETAPEPQAAPVNQVPEVVNQEVTQPVNEVPTVVNQTQPVPTQEVPNVSNGIGNVPPTDVGNPENGGNSPHTKTSEAYTNTGKRGGGWNETEYNQYTDESQFQYEDQTERESVTKAIDMINEEGFEGFKDRVMGKERMSASEIDGLMMEWRILCKQARDMEASGVDATDAWRESVRVFRKVQEQASNNAQALQAMAKWSRNTPEGMLAQAENILNGRTKVEKSAAQKVLDKFQKEHKGFQFSDEFVGEFLTEAEKLKDLDPKSREYKKAMAELGRMVNSQLPAKFSEKLTSFLMDNMLGNFRTLITRNAGGNIGLNAVEQLLERPLAALIDRGLANKTGRRTQAGLTKAGILEYLQGFGKGLKEEADDFKSNLYTSRSGEVTFEDAIAKNRHVFKEGGLLDRFYDKMVKHGLSIGDRPFYEAVYNQTLGDYKRLRESGQMGELIQGLSDEEFNMYAEAAAKMNALAAVYQQDTTLANALLGFKNSIGDLSRGLIGVDVLSQFSMPFVKTPANVIERAIDYSPLGLVRNAFRTGKELKNGNFDQNRFANETARNILGTALMGGGAAFANAGGMEGAYSKDKDEKKVPKDAGMIEYGLKLPGGYETDIGWVPVVGSNLVASAAAMDAFNKGEGNAASNLATGLLAGGKAQLDQSMFQGMQRLFGGSGSYDTDKNLFSNMTDVFSSGLGQLVPSLLRQTGQVSDEYQRDLSNSNPDASLLFMDNYDINSLANTLPILRNNALAPKVGTNGELLEENQGRNVGMKILEDMILPGKISKVEYSALNEEANRLKEATTSADAYMPSASRTLVDTDEHKLTNQEWVDYEQKYYKEMTDIGTQVIESDFYNNADDIEKTSMLKQAYDGIKYGVNHEYNGKEVSGAAKAYVEAGGGEDGVNAVLDYVKKKAISNQVAEKTGYSATSKAAKEIADDIIAGNTDDANQAIQDAQQNVKPYVESAEALGIDATQYSQVKNYAGDSWSKVEPELPKLKELGVTNYSQYAHAKNYANKNGQNIDTQWFANQTKLLDKDNSGGVSQVELTDYFNANNMSEPEVMRMWGMLALGQNGTETKSVPYIITRGKNKGKWGYH